jgi:hypothetical protein
MKNRILKYLSNESLIIGAAIGIYALADRYILKSRLPAGACPVTNNKPLLYTAIALCGISFVLSLFEQKPGK